MEVTSVTTETNRLSREAWLEKALEVLSREGNGKLRIASISAELGVSKGSFYWHFKDRADFLYALLSYWDEYYTRRVQDTVEASGVTAKDRLCHVMMMVMREDLTRYDVAFDAWASHEPDILPKVQGVYQFRYDYIRSQFKELGFQRNELDLRTRAYLGYLYFRPPKGQRLPGKGVIKKRLEFFIRQ